MPGGSVTHRHPLRHGGGLIARDCPIPIACIASAAFWNSCLQYVNCLCSTRSLNRSNEAWRYQASQKTVASATAAYLLRRAAMI